MNTKTIIAASLLSLLAAGSAFAQTASGGLTREQVRAELMRARAAGEIPENEVQLSALPIGKSTSTVTRAQVIAEYYRARANGEIATNDTDYPKMPATTSTVTREQVKAELAAARARGEIPQNEVDFDIAHQMNKQ